MTSSDDLQFPLDTNFSLLSDPPETCNALTECPKNPSLLALENGNNEIVGSVSISAATIGVYPSALIENPRTDQETLTTNSSVGPEMVPQHQSFHHQDDYSRSFNAVENFPGMPSFTFRNGQREGVYSENCLLTSTNKVMTAGFQSNGVQHGFVNQSYQQPSLSQTIPNLSKEPYMGTNVQQVGRTNGSTNLNPNFQDHYIHPSLFQEERYDDDLLLEKLKHIHEYDQMHRPEPSNIPIPPYVGARLSNQHQIPCASSRNTKPNPENQSYSPFAQTSYQSDPYAFNFQNSSSLQTTTRRPRGRPRKNLIPMPLVLTTQTPLTSHRHYGTQDKGKQHITAMPSMNPTLYDQYQNSYTNIMTQQSGVLRQRSCNDQLENESSSSKRRRIMGTFQEKSIADSSTVSFWQNENMRSSAGYAANYHDERSIQNAVYDPLYTAHGLPLDPHLRFV
ncbi:hypothetical protein Bca52824_014232 [Brassica carinata]|uniref:Uncharacterized protein n=1 Tax=Brassica carinata TaxID=52824 RepID=A0A8X7W0P3_BRACI|nr:hypothetical protein Bca52824_014232 [Brassica carinata]